ncbi:MAG: VWA domain-containing protein [Deltaproteobacteria bacterium]|nr:VWA domain-containing protein [Deltaproteobacteria bacterium]
MRKLAWASMVALAMAWGCSVQVEANKGADEPSFSTGSGYGVSSSASGGADDADGTGPGENPSGGGEPQAGQLTAGVWDDNRNFEFFQDYLAKHADDEGRLDFTKDEVEAAHARSLVPSDGHATLDVAIVIDTTGSMGDELAYLKSEVKAISEHIAERYPKAEQRWALVAYRDVGDEYVVLPSDFAKPAAFGASLAALEVNGGGDTPEAPDAALEKTAELTWRGGDTARLVFWIADAPHHVGKAQKLAGAMRALAAKDAHVYPVASSGVDDLAELAMRTSAQLTNGRYLFLTDDSGIGGEHKEPEIPCYFVTRLDRAIERMVDIEMSGDYLAPAAADILRTGGDPQDGKCVLDTQEVQIF